MSQTYNFCAGPAMLPHAVMEQAQKEFINWNNTGVSVMELSHRSKDYMAVATAAEQDLRDLLAIPDNYKVIFSQGGGRGQFAAVPLNILGDKTQADYLLTGQWSKSAVVEGKKYCQVNESNILMPSTDGIVAVKPASQWQISSKNTAYVHYCPNETIEGIEINDIPDTGDIPLVADMSSNILSKPLDISKFGIIYAGAQKNIGPSGLGVVIVRDDLLDKAKQETPSIFNYKLMAENGSMFNTPPTYSWYLAGLVFKWLKAQGGLSAIEEINAEKAKLLYGYIDSSDFYGNNVATVNRSKMNVPFTLASSDLDTAFLQQSLDANLMALKGHRIVGGMRASIYNAMPIEGVKALIGFMEKFERQQRGL